jgi:hypothetical protein
MHQHVFEIRELGQMHLDLELAPAGEGAGVALREAVVNTGDFLFLARPLHHVVQPLVLVQQRDGVNERQIFFVVAPVARARRGERQPARTD